MHVRYTAKDTDGAILTRAVFHAATWLEACRMGMTIRNQLANDGITVEWRKVTE
jgi:hypothetical protein